MKKVKLVSLRMITEKEVLLKDNVIKCAGDAFETVKETFNINEYGTFDREYTIVIGLNVHYQINCINVVSIGTLNAAYIEPREVFKALLLSNSAFFILLHNHPAGNVKPSYEDKEITRRLYKCGEMMGINMLDHVIFSDSSFDSIREDEGSSSYIK